MLKQSSFKAAEKDGNIFYWGTIDTSKVNILNLIRICQHVSADHLLNILI